MSDKVVTESMLQQAVDAILNGIQKMFDNHEKRFEKVEKKLEVLGSGHKHIRQDIQDLKWDTVTGKEFSKLKKKVYRHHPSN